MKTFIYIFFCMLLAVPAFAQEPDEIDDQVEKLDPKTRKKLTAAHAAYITEHLGLTAEEAEKFWPIYREFFDKRRATRQQMKDARQSGKSSQELLDLDLKIKQQELDLEKDYTGRLRRIVAPEKLANLRQAERDFRRMLIRQIQQQQQRRQEMRDRSLQQLRQRNN